MRSSISRHAVVVFLSIASASAVNPSALAQSAGDEGPAPDPSESLAPMPDLGVDWPDLSQPETPDPETPVDPENLSAPAAQEATEANAQSLNSDAEYRYSVNLEGLDGIDVSAIRSRFDLLSTLRQGGNKAVNGAQINRRARADEKLLRELLESEGYYDAEVVTRINAASPDRIAVILRSTPGTRYTFTEITIEGLAGGGERAEAARKAFVVGVGDPVRAENVIAATTALRQSLADNGFPFAKIGEPAVTVDHQTRSATLILAAETGSFARFGRIILRGNKLPFSAKHVGRIARFKSGDTYNRSDIEDLRRAIIATGLVSSVTITPAATTDPEIVDVAIALERAPRRTVAGELGYGTGEGFRAEISWTHRNLIRPEGAVTFRGVAGTREQYLGALLRRNNYKARDRVLTAQIAASHVRRDAFDARTLTLGGGLERQSNIIWQKKWTWSLGGEVAISDERDNIVATGLSRRRTFYIAGVPGTLAYDGSDDLLDPKKGFRLSGRLSPEVSFHNGTFTYARVQIDTSYYQPMAGRVVLAGRMRLGTIAGAKRDQIAPSRRFYAGGGGSVRGYGYQDIGPRDVDNDPIGGRSITEFSLEARVRFGDFGVVPFFDAGNIYTSPLPRFTGMQYGAGLGVRYYTNFGPIRVDVGTPLNRRAGDARVAVYVSLGQAF